MRHAFFLAATAALAAACNQSQPTFVPPTPTTPAPPLQCDFFDENGRLIVRHISSVRGDNVNTVLETTQACAS